MPLSEELKDFGRSLGGFFVKAGKAYVSNVKEKVKGTLDFGKAVARAGPRAAAAVATEAFGQKTYTPGAAGHVGGKLERFLLGPEPVESLSTQVEKLPERGEALGIPGKFTKPIAVPLVVGSTLLDIIPGMGGRKNLVKQVAKETTEEGVFVLLKKNIKGITDDHARAISTVLAPIKDEKEVGRMIEGYAEARSREAAKAAGKGAESSMADFVVGEKKVFDSLSRKASELDRRIEAGSERRARDIKRDADSMVLRLLNENRGSAEIPTDQIQTIQRFINEIGPSLFDDVGLRIRSNGGQQGLYNYSNGVIEIFKSNIRNNGGDFGRTTIHELWHSLSRFLPDEDLVAVNKTFLRERQEYLTKNPWFDYVLKNPSGLTKEQYEILKKQFPEQAKFFTPTGDYGIAPRYEFKYSKENYRFKELDEWFAENMTDKSLERFARMDESSRSVVLHLKNVLRSMLESVQRLFGRDVAGRISDKFFSNTELFIEREGGLKSTLKRSALNIDNTEAKKGLERERGFVTSVKEKFPEALKVAGQYIPRSTDELSTAARNFVRDDIQAAEKLAMTGSDDKAVATATELIKHYGDAAANASDTATKAALEDKLAEVANEIAKKLTEQGRAIQAASILGRMTPEGQVRFAAREIQKYNEAVSKSKLPFSQKIPELTGEQAGKIVEQMKDIAEMPDGLPKAKAFKDLQDGIMDLVPTPLMKKIATVWKAGLLTGLKTSGLNIFSNASHFAAETIKDVPAVIVDKVASLFTGVRTKALTLRGTPGGVVEGFGKGWEYLKTSVDERDMMSKLDYRRVNFGKSVFARTIQKYEETVFKVLASEDQPFYYGMKARSIADQAIARGKTLELIGDDLDDFVREMIKNPDDERLRYAAIDAETAVFQNRTAISEVGKAVQDLGKGTRAEGTGEFVVPFSRTPSAVAMQVINYSPIGIVKTIIENIGKGKFDQRLFSQGIGRGLTGTAGLYLGTKLFDKGDFITLDFPKDEREQKLWELEGRKSNSIKVGDKWRTVQSLGPAGTLLIVGAYFQREMKASGSATSAMAKAMFGGLKSFTDQTFLQGIKKISEAVNDSERFADAYFGNLTASFVPTIVSDVARAHDLKERVSRTTLDRVKARIPFLREEPEPKIDVLGREVDVGGNALEVMLDPTRPSKDVSTLVVKELRRLSYEGFRVSPTLLGDKHGYDSLTPEQNTQLWKDAGGLIGKKLKSLFANEAYRKMDSEKKVKTIDSFVEKVKLLARAKTLLEITHGLTGSALKAELSKQKEGRFMTKEVYNKYLELRGSGVGEALK